MLIRFPIHFLLCTRFGEEEEAMDLCNDTVHGLCGEPALQCTTIHSRYSVSPLYASVRT